MASLASSSAEDLNESRAEALQALLNSLSPGDPTAENGGQLTSDQVRKMSDKLGEVLGDGAFASEGGEQRRNEKGELLNEEGLPVVDITEPISETPSSEPGHIFNDPDLLPLWALSPAEKARRRAERERILDLLEEEEQLEQERAEAAERERYRSELEKRKEAAKAQLDSLRKAKELQKKMGKALLRNVIESKEREEHESVQKEKEKETARTEKNQKPAKSVSFAEPPSDHESTPAEGSEQGKWGDVSLARLQRKGKSTLLTKAQMAKQPMKMEVVERHPAESRPSLSTSAQVLDGQDSDDESIPGSPMPTDSDEGEIIHSDHYDEEDNRASAPSMPPESDSTDNEHFTDDGEPTEWTEDESDDFARHQHDIERAYYEKRATIGAQVASAMRAHTHSEDEDEWDQAEVPLEATRASAPPKTPVSKFKSERLSNASSSTLASHSLGRSVLPSSQSSSLKSAIRMGKLESDQLVGEESDDDVEKQTREVLELLSRGEVTNISLQTSPTPAAGESVRAISAVSSSPLQTPSAPTIISPDNVGNAAAAPKPKPSKVSKFKMALSQAQQVQDSALPSPPMTTPISVTERSSPKMASPGPGTPIAVPTASSRLSPRTPAHTRSQMPSMIVDSPSFLPPARMSLASVARPSPGPASCASPIPFRSVIIESPSFQPMSTVNSSPSLSSPPMPSSSTSSAGNSIKFAPADRPAVIMAAEVKESDSTSRRTAGAEGKEKKVSRFLAERM
ncbi:uncharacterized protein LAESUDRAFT_646357 [Laetiporus sulphureus 93-53]|uniref:DUF3835 domain-containing protein n=1 Tax=Laetiporus sulphureus 93-53 TaxID=1314785 RepID=A0A165FZH2_9APHY|nr:uncharacterized protein LAESUDRAFT_646357 [Laetiporus sulphureus 93-53]KZT09621.1 hypothetical protein LAESUDRAFT_646357 [Laetiporus sulphureus 93-53]